MSLDKRRGGISKTQPKAPLKQRTLLDSFVTRISSKAVPLESSLQLGESSITTIDTCKDMTEDIESSKDPCGLSLDSNRRRSPSVVVIEDTPEPISPQSSVLNSEDHSNGSGRSIHRPITITIDSSPSPIRCPSPLELDKKPVNPFFLPRSTNGVKARRMHSGKKFVGTRVPPNASLFYPQGMPQHIKGTQTTFACHHSPPPRAREIFEKCTDEKAKYHFLKSPEQEPPPPDRVRLFPTSNDEPINDIPEDVKNSFPAVARLISLKPGDKPTSNRPWADRWRPSCAREVLGNEQSAIYLRDWLRALELQLEENAANSVSTNSSQDHKKVEVSKKAITRGIKRPRVIRAVDKARRKRSRLDSDEDEDNWIVYTDDEEDVGVDYDQFDGFDEIVMNGPPASSPSSSVHESSQEVIDKHEEPTHLGQLHNTILITGPPGCGKTASVYACAEELGWDVFEVYPGIGRRNGLNIDNLIGEVGKNHLVTQTRTSGDTLRSFLQSKAKRESVEEDQECSALSQMSPRKKSAIEATPANAKSVQQSLILLEEVDILFKDDANFWTTVTKIIRECKRPVVCTCNDLSLVPVQDLPLQTTLFYTPCPEEPAACYLQALCAAEGYAVSWKDLLRVYSNPQGTMNDKADLRATINALQADCATAVGRMEETSGMPPRISVKGSDSLSFVDGYLEQNMASRYSILAELGDHIPSEDDETGHIILFDRHGEEAAPIESYERQREILAATVVLGNKVFGKDESRETGMEMSERCGRQMGAKLRVAAREICRLGVDGMEYLPYVRQMVEAEDINVAKEERRQGRRTRNSTRSQYVRMVELTAHARESVSVAWK